ncbi:MAG: hypothetical protein NTW25_08300 [Candidatus Kapabacteria bacterium]|nr:hypothetical protein [Candidatus Kapabacteria bacterium]
MKYFIIGSIFLFQIYLYGNQSPNPNCEPKIIRTDPKVAINSEQSQKTNTNGVILDWTKPFSNPYFDVNCEWYNPHITSIETPYHQGNNSAIDNLHDKIDLPEDGWELIFRNLGYLDNGSERSGNEDNPYFIIYNKYTGILRVFVAVANQKSAYRYTDIRLHFKEGESFYTSLLDFSLSTAEKPMRALDDFVNVNKANILMKNLTSFVNNGKKWFYADFPMTYDPCTCEKLSKIKIEVRLIQKAEINFTGTLSGTITNIDNKNSINQNTKIDDTKSSLSTFIDGGSKIFDTYKKWDSFKGEINTNISASEVTTPSIDKPKAVVGLNLLEKAIKSSGFAKEVINQLPLIGATLQFLDFFTSGGQSSVEPTNVRIMPASITANINLTGNIITDEGYQDILFYNPGSDFFSSNPSLDQYPYYNQVLGVMNLLNTPKIDYSKSNIATTNILGCQEVWSANEDSVCTGSITLNQKLSFKLPSNLNYVVNPAVFKTNSDDIEIYGSYTIQLDSYYSDIDPNNLLGTITNTNASFPNIATDLIIRKGINKEYYTEYFQFNV